MSNVHDIVRGRDILIIEDEVLIAFELIDVLEDLGAATTGPIVRAQDVLPAVQQQQPDAVILDLNLQGVPSQPLAAVLIAMGIPMIFTTGYAKEDIVAQFPGIPVLEKPCNPQDIIDALSTILMEKKALPGPADAAMRVA